MWISFQDQRNDEVEYQRIHLWDTHVSNKLNWIGFLVMWRKKPVTWLNELPCGWSTTLCMSAHATRQLTANGYRSYLMESAVQPSITWAWLPRKNEEFRVGTFPNPALIPKIHRNVVSKSVTSLTYSCWRMTLLIGSLSTQGFWATDGNRKWAVFSFNLPSLLVVSTNSALPHASCEVSFH